MRERKRVEGGFADFRFRDNQSKWTGRTNGCQNILAHRVEFLLIVCRPSYCLFPRNNGAPSSAVGKKKTPTSTRLSSWRRPIGRNSITRRRYVDCYRERFVPVSLFGYLRARLVYGRSSSFSSCSQPPLFSPKHQLLFCCWLYVFVEGSGSKGAMVGVDFQVLCGRPWSVQRKLKFSSRERNSCRWRTTRRLCHSRLVVAASVGERRAVSDELDVWRVSECVDVHGNRSANNGGLLLPKLLFVVVLVFRHNNIKTPVHSPVYCCKYLLLRPSSLRTHKKLCWAAIKRTREVVSCPVRI